jgi:hypothetical protein
MSLELQDQILKTKDEVKVLRVEYENCGKNILVDYKHEIVAMKNKLQNFLVEQKTENFKLIKEIAIMEKEKIDLQNNIYHCLAKLHKLEKEVGVKTKAYTYMYDQSILENEISNKFIIEKEDI